MLARVQDEVGRYEREERARAVLRGSRVYVVDTQRRLGDIERALSWAGADIARFESLAGAATGLFGSQRADALIVDASVSDREGARMLDRADPNLALFLCGGGPKAAARLRRSFGSSRPIPVLDRPAARFELLEFAAAAVSATRRVRRGRREQPTVGLGGEPPEPVARPQPDEWSCEQLRDRICYWGGELGLSERETQVMRGAVRRLKNKEIAEQLEVSVHAVKKYLRELLQKLGLESRHEIAWLLERTPTQRLAETSADDR
jgi:DNA-binding CsgD family transcriptional regulator